MLGKTVEIPTEGMWLLAAGYGMGYRYPWGNLWRPKSCNSREYGKGSTTSVYEFEDKGNSPFGCVDMLGNLWEWTQSLHSPDDNQDFRWRAVRGGANYNNLERVGVLTRLWANPGHFLFVRDLCLRVVYQDK